MLPAIVSICSQCKQKQQVKEKKELKVCVTGGAGQIAYSFIPLLCSGQVLGDEVEIDLRLLDIPACEQVLQGVQMEITDGAYPLVNKVTIGSDPYLLFQHVDLAIFIGGFPRKQGMERKDLLKINGKIFKEQGLALEKVASRDVKVVVVANPANTNCMLLAIHAPSIPRENFTALTRLDQNRALSQISQKTQVGVKYIKNAIIWGNHSATQVPDVRHCWVGNQQCYKVVNDDHYLHNEFIQKVQKRGAEIISVKKTSSIFSAANALKDHLHDWYLGNSGVVNSMAMLGGHYGVDPSLVFSYPVRCHGNWIVTIEHGIGWHDNQDMQKRINATIQELQEEKEEAMADL